MKLTQAQYDHYWTKGWLVINGVIDPKRAEAMAQLATTLAMQHTMKRTDSTLFVDRSADGKSMAPRKLDFPFEKDCEFGRMIYQSPLPQLLNDLLKVQAVFCSDQAFMKPPKHGSPKAYHQDNDYFKCTPDDHVITAWIAMDDVNEENGCLRYIDGSHKGGILPSKPISGREHDLTPDPSLIDLSKESLAIVKKGGVVFHHGNTLHCSGENRSERWRRGYATHWLTNEVTCKSEVLDKPYFRRPDLWRGWGDQFYAQQQPKTAAAAK